MAKKKPERAEFDFVDAVTNDQLRAAVSRLTQKLADREARHEEYVETLYAAVKDASSGLVIPPVKRPVSDRRRKGDEVAVALLSDMQLAKVTPDYSSEVCEERVLRYADKIISIADVQRSDHPVRKCVVTMLGDIIEGEDIFPGQQWLIDASLYRQITDVGPRIIVTFLRKLLTAFDVVEVFECDGNHGRIGRRGQMHPETNGDRMLSNIVRQLLANEPRIVWHSRDPKGERNWYNIAEIGNYRALMIHGDQIRGHSGFPWYGLGKKVNGWASGAIREPFQDVFMGHWHQRACIPLNQRNVYVNGSTESYNTFAQENLAAQSDPSQWLLFVDPRAGRVTASYGVDLT